MAASERLVYGRAFKPTSVQLWLAQRISGLLLGPLVLLHMMSASWAANRLLNALLLAAILVHGYAGLRRMIALQPRARLMLAAALGWCAVVAVFGALLVIYR